MCGVFMKIVFVSDIHGSFGYAKMIPEILQREEADKLVILGDLYYHGPRNPLPLEYAPMEVSKLLNGLEIDKVAVRGNCDAEVDVKITDFDIFETLEFECGKNKVFCSHGQNYNIDKFPDSEFDVMIYGHKHTGFIMEKNAKVIANAGSISLPKDGTKNSYLVLTEERIELKDLNGNKITDKSF